MNKLIRNVKLKGIVKVICSILFAIVVAFVCSESGIETGEKILVCILWYIPVIIYFFGGITNIKYASKYVDEYIKKSGYSKKQLDEEFEQAKKFSNISIGKNHVFAISSDSAYIIPIVDIEKVYYINWGANPAKGRPGYYYLYLQGEKIAENIKIYFVSKTNVQEAVNYLLGCNSNIEFKK